ncbi:type II toxin-antitoxin system VapC family toxin [Candidatus Accumulibacter phosphatis]|uniref:Type II toxin-antitoxin system VapC family toxin n=1 Tax=Candidatus Accumulibacter phosphatis TaxID=327160 RepID=A0ABX1TZA7_9PROT|nr:type II toxin-antitoxin system VapC family toxin [Candidatus Accumulibacter phosphatis]NMQ29535.1 type II toxin-antitoxin system VapC family toxin [Candidatus Accumulibacter phosphatis]
MWLADSNILIRAVARPGHPLQDWLLNNLPAISVVTRIETLGYHRLGVDEEKLLQALLGAFDEYQIGPQTVSLAISLRRQRKMTLGDALVAATCLEHGLHLATRNVRDFDWIPGLRVDSLSEIPL